MLELGYALDAQPHAVSHVKGHVRSLSWVRDGSVALVLPGLPRIDDYVRLVRDREYSFLMHDGAAIQILYQYERSVLVRHRLLYWPCPFDAEDAFRQFGYPVVDLLEALFLGNIRTEVVLRGLLRFDYVPDAAREFHPASHLTLARSECRIPVHAPLSFDTFMRFVLENFYLEAWSDQKIAAHFACQQEVNSIHTRDLERVHLAWRYS